MWNTTLSIQHKENYNVSVIDEDGEEHLCHANDLQEWDIHHFKDWKCQAGVKYLYVTENGDAWGSQCENDYLGNVYEHVVMLCGWTVCKQEKCTGCTNDLAVKKHK